jgi:hypothetical protein
MRRICITTPVNFSGIESVNTVFTVALPGEDQLKVFGSAVSGDVIFAADFTEGTDDDSITVDTDFFDASHVIVGLGGDDTVVLRGGLGLNSRRSSSSASTRLGTTA